MNELDIEFNMGLAEDTRSPEEKAKDYQHPSLEGALVLNWIEKPKDQWKKYTPREQDGSLSCFAQASAKAFEIMTGEITSAHPPYRSRSNFPAGGMFPADVGAVCKNPGSTLESLDASQFEGESVMNRPISVDTPMKIGGYFFVDHHDMDAIAEAIELHKHCILVTHCNKQEWTAIPKYDSSLAVNFGHAFCAVDYFLHDGKKVYLIEDSTGHHSSIEPELTGQRLLTQEFVKARIVSAMYFVAPPTQYVFPRTLRFGMRGADVSYLQKLLRDKGYFTHAITQYFGSITLQAVKEFQFDHPPLMADGIAGSKTVAKLQE